MVGGDRLSEANSRNLQWAYANGLNTEERLDGMEFMFEDWHAIRMLFQVSNVSHCDVCLLKLLYSVHSLFNLRQ